MPFSRRSTLLGAALWAAAATAVAPLRAQDSLTVVAGAEYRAAALHRTLLGSGYRDVWTTPVRVEVLDLGRFAGGLTPERRGGGNQTRSLRLQGADGREYVFRSTDKELSPALPEDLRATLVDDLLQDQVSSLHPGAVLVAGPLLAAAGVLHAPARLVVLPDDPTLGEFRAEFGGMLGTLAEHPQEGEDDAPGFAGAIRVAGTDRLFEHLEEDPEHRVDERAFLRARLMDLFFGDWDRHEEQWRWARFDRDGLRIWQPVPGDPDYIFVDYGGLLVRASGVGKAVRFDEGIGNLGGLVVNAYILDQRLLSGLERAAWDSVAADLRTRLSDSVIAAATRRLPPEWYALTGPRLERTLRARRDALPGVASRFYSQLARTVDIRGTDERDFARIERAADGSVEVRLYADGEKGREGEPRFRRRFVPDETEEVRIHLHGDDDRAEVRGDGPARIAVRVIGGGGDDLLADSATGRVAFYDDRGENRFVTRPGTRVDERPYEAPLWERGRLAGDPPRDRGRSTSLFVPWGGWKSNVGVVVGGGPAITRYGFRQDPYGYRLAGRVEFAPTLGRFAGQAEADFRRAGSAARLSVLARASDIEAIRFHGFGNETPDADSEQVRIRQSALLLEPLWHLPVAGATVSLGPVLRYSDPEVPAGSPLDRLRPLGSGSFGRVGGQGALQLDGRDSPAVPRHGFQLEAGGSAFPAVWDAAEPFGSAHLRGTAYLSPAGSGPTLALRAGGRRAWGGVPLQEAATVGGSRSLRGYPEGRFIGDAAVFGGAELRSVLTRTKLLVRGDLGALALVDAGRVFVDGERSDLWHTGAGGGLWFSGLEGRYVASALYVRGEDNRVYLNLGLPF